MKKKCIKTDKLNEVFAQHCPDCLRHKCGEIRGRIRSREGESVIGDCDNPFCGAEYVFNRETRKWDLQCNGDDKRWIMRRRENIVKQAPEVGLARFAGGA